MVLQKYKIGEIFNLVGIYYNLNIVAKFISMLIG